LQNGPNHHGSAPVAAPFSAQVGFAALLSRICAMIADQDLAANERETANPTIADGGRKQIKEHCVDLCKFTFVCPLWLKILISR
jgi:hypothetical protein